MRTKFEDVKAGDKVIANGTHRCLNPGQVLTVHDNGSNGRLSVACNGLMGDTFHQLTSDDDGYLVGFAKMRDPS